MRPEDSSEDSSRRRAQRREGAQRGVDRSSRGRRRPRPHARTAVLGLGVETVHADIGITVSYWTDEESIAAWKRDADHAFAQYEGRTRWYDAYELRVARVERAHSFVRDGT